MVRRVSPKTSCECFVSTDWGFSGFVPMLEEALAQFDSTLAILTLARRNEAAVWPVEAVA
jgi:hypothetical protein